MTAINNHERENNSFLALELTSQSEKEQLMRIMADRASYLFTKTTNSPPDSRQNITLAMAQRLYIQIAQNLGVFDQVSTHLKATMGLLEYVTPEELQALVQQAEKEHIGYNVELFKYCLARKGSKKMSARPRKKTNHPESNKGQSFLLELTSRSEQEQLMRILSGYANAIFNSGSDRPLRPNETVILEMAQRFYVQIAQNLGVWQELDTQEKLSLGLLEYVTVEDIEALIEEATKQGGADMIFALFFRYCLDCKLGKKTRYLSR